MGTELRPAAHGSAAVLADDDLIDVVFFGPFYACALYAFIRGRDWIRLPAVLWSGTMLANVLIILMEERYGAYATAHWGIVLAANLPWLLLPVAVVTRMARSPHPFSEPATVDPARPRRSAGHPAPYTVAARLRRSEPATATER